MRLNRKYIVFGKLAGFAPVLILVAWIAFGWSAPSSAQESSKISSNGLTIAHQALKDTLYYRFDNWFALFREKIEQLEAAPQSVGNRLEQIRYNFYYSGMLGEICHTLAFTSKYKIEKIEKEFLHYSTRAREMAREILKEPGLTDRQKAEAYLYLGAAEGYIGIFEYGAGNLLAALINGFQADNHLEKALAFAPDQVDANFGLGIYRYGNSRLGGIGNFLMQGGRDMRRVGLKHIERAIQENATTRPLAMKTLIWFYISEQINPKNSDVPGEHPLYPSKSRARALELMEEMDRDYFDNPPYDDFKGNKELTLMRALQFVLDGDYASAKSNFQKVLEICDHLTKKGFQINPQLIDSVKAGIKFSDLMLINPSEESAEAFQSACLKIDEQMLSLNSGGTMVEYDSKKIRRELHTVFVNALDGLSRKMKCG
jgi:tetratricopeptide (TPR) repeat protein